MSGAIDPAVYAAYAAECGDPSRTKKLGFGTRPALLLVDVCEAYFCPTSALVLDAETQNRTSAAIASLIQASRAGRTTVAPSDPTSLADESDTIPIIYAQTTYTNTMTRDAGLQAQKSKTANIFLAQHPAKLTAVPTSHPMLQPASNDMKLAKKYPSPFFGTNLAAQLIALGVDTLVIAGFLTSGGVRAAALDAMQSGFRPMIVAEAVGDRGLETHWANLMDLAAKYGDVVTVEAAAEALGAGWQT